MFKDHVQCYESRLSLPSLNHDHFCYQPPSGLSLTLFRDLTDTHCFLCVTNARAMMSSMTALMTFYPAFLTGTNVNGACE